jgi:hypothetical protein
LRPRVHPEDAELPLLFEGKNPFASGPCYSGTKVERPAE